MKAARIVFAVCTIGLACDLAPAGGCGCGDPSPTFHDDFESDCGGGIACGYHVVTPPVARTTTVHAGVLGLSIGAGGEVHRDLPPLGSTLSWLQHCDAGASLQFAFIDATGATAWSDASSFACPELDQRPCDTPDSPPYVRHEIGGGGSASVSNAHATGFAFRVVGTGSCAIAEVFSYTPLQCNG